MHNGVKSFLFVLITTVLLGVIMVPAQAAESIISTDVLGDFSGEFRATYESALGDNMSFFVGGIYMNYTRSDVTVNGFGVSGGVNYYFLGKALEGFYACGGVSILMFSAEKLIFPGFGIIASAGYKFYINDQFVLDGKAALDGMGTLGLGFEIGYVLK